MDPSLKNRGIWMIQKELRTEGRILQVKTNQNLSLKASPTELTISLNGVMIMLLTRELK